MQTLNVGAGRTDQEYKAAEEQRRADLRDESRADANYFFIAAVAAGLGTGLLPVRIPILVGIGAIDLLAIYGGHSKILIMLAASGLWIASLVGLGFAAAKGHRWAFLAGVVLYAADMVPLAITFSWMAIGAHAFFIMQWFQGQKALQDLKDAAGPN